MNYKQCFFCNILTTSDHHRWTVTHENVGLHDSNLFSIHTNTLLPKHNMHSSVFTLLFISARKTENQLALLCLSGVWVLFCFPIIPTGFMVWIRPLFCLCLSLARVLIGSPLKGQPARRTGDVYKCPVGHGSSSSCIKLDLPGEHWLYSRFFPVCICALFIFVQNINFSAAKWLQHYFHDKAKYHHTAFCLWREHSALFHIIWTYQKKLFKWNYSK